MRLSGRKASSYALRWTPRQRVVLFALLALNLVAFITQELLEIYQPASIAEYFGLSYRGIDDAYAWQFLTALFLPGNVFQFASNMCVLYFFGRDLELIFGQKHFLYLYLLGAVGGELGHLFLMPNDTVLLAAGGGVAAIAVAFALTLPELEIGGALSSLLPFPLRAKYLPPAILSTAVGLLFIDRWGIVSHSACLGGCAAGWLYAHLLGFGRPSFLQRYVQRRRRARERRAQMSAQDFIAHEIDPVLEKISRCGLASLSRGERRLLAEARAKVNSAPR